MSFSASAHECAHYVLRYTAYLLLLLVVVVKRRCSELKKTMHEASKHPCSPRHLSQVLVQLLRTWRFFSHQGMMVSLLALCGLLGAAVHLRLALASNSTLLWTHWETYVSMPTRGASVTAPVRDPRLLSPFPPRSALTAAFFCGRPTASSYDGYAGAAHAAYIHHDMDHDRFVVRTFGRGGTRVDLRRRTGIGRSTYEVFCGASVHAQTRTPLAPSPWVEGEANWQLSTAESHARPTNGGFNYTLEELAKPLSARGTSDHFDADFTKADQGLRTHYRRYSRDEVLAKNRHMDFIYSYVNGSDVTRLFLKPFATSGQCSSATTSVQLLWGALLRLKSAELADLGTSEKEFSRSVTAVLFADMSSPCSLADLHSSTVTSSEAVKRVQQSLEAALRAGTANPAAYASGTSHSTLTVSEMMTALGVTEALNKQDFLD
ncbi:putative transmembrane protein, partial [Leptomonas pyrrhocoris]